MCQLIAWLRAGALMLMLLVATTTVAVAHDPGLSTAEVRLTRDAAVVVVSLAPADARVLHAFEADAWRGWCTFECDGRSFTAVRVRPQPASADAAAFELTFAPLAHDRALIRFSQLAHLPSGHREFVVIEAPDQSIVAKKFVSATDATFEFEAPDLSTPSTAERRGAMTVRQFIELGVGHIWTGYDHLLFLLSLVIVCRSFRSIVKIVSCFTLAHSLTLALAATQSVVLPSRWVESAIAASIVFVAVENLIRNGAEPRGRWLVTFLFGLVHGFGFASALTELGLGRTGVGVVAPLFGFNLGVEIGQIAVAALALPLLWSLKRHARFSRFGVPATSALIALVGSFWLFVRATAA